MVKRILSLLFVFLFAACSYDLNYIVENVPGPAKKSPIVVHVDSNFSDKQKQDIKHAFIAWEVASKHTIVFQPLWDTERPGNFLDYRNSNRIFLWYLPKTKSHFYPSELMDHFSIDGVVYRRYIYDQVVIFKDSPKEHFYIIVLHELGHLLGLEHINYEKAIMHKNVTSKYITDWDQHQLCDIYKC